MADGDLTDRFGDSEPAMVYQEGRLLEKGAGAPVAQESTLPA